VSMPFKYYLNAAFRWKMLLLVFACAAMAWLSRSEAEGKPAGWQRALALLTWLLWLGVGVSGRLIGFL
jgi:hypothetical protein